MNNRYSLSRPGHFRMDSRLFTFKDSGHLLAWVAGIHFQGQLVGIYWHGQQVFTFKDSGHLLAWAAGIHFQGQWAFISLGSMYSLSRTVGIY